MRHIISFTILFFIGIFSLSAQIIINQHTEDVLQHDTLIVQTQTLDSTLVGVSVFQLIKDKKSVLDGNIYIEQPDYMRDAFYHYITGNAHKKRNGYRIRLYFDNKQSARGESDLLKTEFNSNYPDIPIYRSYSAPYFKIVVGDYRTKSEAMRVLNQIKGLYPKAIIIKEQIGFPHI